MKISYSKLKDIIEYIQKQKRQILITVDDVKLYEREPLRDTYKSYLYLYKILNHYYTNKKYFNKHNLYFIIKTKMINFTDKKPFYNILNKIENLL